MGTFCWTTVRARSHGLPTPATSPLCSRQRDPDPSRNALWHGSGDFGRRACRDHAGLPDSVAELPFACRGERLARRLRSNRSGRDRTVYRQGPERGSEHIETSCRTLHRQSESHKPPVPAQIPASLQPRSIKHAAVLEPVKAGPFGWPRKTRPALTGPARGGCEIYGRDERMFAARIELKNGNLTNQSPKRSAIFATP